MSTNPNYMPTQMQCQSFKTRSVPFATKDTIAAASDKLEAEGIVEKAVHSKWAAPIKAILKKDGTFRNCGDHKVTVNADQSRHGLPKPDELFASLAKGQKFSKLNLLQV